MEEILIQSALLSIVDSMNMSLVSTQELDLGKPDIYNYIEKNLAKLLDDPAVKRAAFSEESLFLNRLRQFGDGTLDLSGFAQYVVAKMDMLMKDELNIPAADLLTGTAQIDGKQMFYLLKLNHRSAYTHIVENEGGLKVDLVRHLMTLPASKADEGALISLGDLELQVLEKPYNLNGGRRCYFASDLLDCHPQRSARELIKVLDQTAQQVNSELNEPNRHIVPVMKNALYQMAEQAEELSLDRLIDEVFEENVNAKQAFRAELVKSGVPETISMRETQVHKILAKQKISTDSGIELNLPIALYHDSSIIEFINNPDGTISILIKGINKLTNK